MSAGKKLMLAFLAALLAAGLFIAWLGAGRTGERLCFDNTKILETKLSAEADVQVRTVVLPEAFDAAESLLFKSTHERAEVLLDGEIIYAYGMEKPLFGKSPGTYWHVVDLPAHSAGRQLQVRLTTVYDDFYGSNIEIRYGGRGDCILALVKNFLPVLILNCIIITVGLISLFLHVVTLRRQKKGDVGSFLCISLFALTIALWSLRQCGFLQFLIPSGQALYFADLLLFFLFPVPLNLFIYSVCRSRYKRGFLCIGAAYLVLMAAEFLLQALGVCDIFELLRSIHALMLLNALYVFWAIHREARQENGSLAGRIRLPLYVLMAFGLMEMISYYIRLFDDISIFLPTGTIVFIVMLIWRQVGDHYQALLEEQKMLYYEKLANTDMLTGAFSRNAYENALKSLAAENPAGQGIVFFDLNNMKVINDTCGHEKGDEALRRTYRCILEAFGDAGRCYRIGGDEFAFLTGGSADLEACVQKFNALVRRENEGLDFPLSAACGYAVFDDGIDREFRDTIRRSDAMMYDDKKRKKEGDIR